MSMQPQLFPETPTEDPPAAGTNQREPNPGNTAPLWLQRLSLFILVLFCVYLGVILTILPWWSAVWDHNPFFATHRQLWAFLRLGAVRGVISGFGLLDVWIGISEAVHYREDHT